MSNIFKVIDNQSDTIVVVEGATNEQQAIEAVMAGRFEASAITVSELIVRSRDGASLLVIMAPRRASAIQPKRPRKPRAVKAKPEPAPVAQPVVSAEPSSTEPVAVPADPAARPFPWTERAAQRATA